MDVRPNGAPLLPWWITTENRTQSEWKFFRGSMDVADAPTFAEVLFSSIGVCALYVNGEFVESSTSRNPGRINRHEVTSRLHGGENVIALKLGSSYLWGKGQEEFRRRGFWFSEVALLLRVRLRDGKEQVWCTDGQWLASLDERDGWRPCDVTRRVRPDEFSRFWEPSALWREPIEDAADVPAGLLEVVGEGYTDNLKLRPPVYEKPCAVAAVDAGDGRVEDVEALLQGGGCTRIDPAGGQSHPYVILDFGRLVVGYLEVAFRECGPGTMRCEFDVTESLDDFGTEDHRTQVVDGSDIVAKMLAPTYRATVDIFQSLAVETPSGPQTKEWLNVRRRAFRYVKISFSDLTGPILVESVRLRNSLYPCLNRGRFECSDPLLNQIWEIGRYTLLVNKHQEYESCPRNEMLFFSGDGRIDGLVDCYAFGDGALMWPSLSFNCSFTAGGICWDTEHTARGLWDYPCWRIISIWDHFMHWGDTEFVKRFYPSAVAAMEWLMARVGENGLIEQLPVDDIVEWTCSSDRLGEKAFLNSLFYKSLLCMPELAAVVGEEADSKRSAEIAARVREAINRRLWSDESGCYVDTLYDYIPQDGNVLAITCGVADDARRNTVLETLKRETWTQYGSAMFDRVIEHTRSGRATISPLMCAYEAEAHFTAGRESDALDLIRRCWGTMADKGAKTWWEYSPNDGHSWWPFTAHAWSAGPTYLLPAYVLGVRPIKPGFREVLVAPKLGDLEWARGVVPTPRGPIGLDVRSAEAGLLCSLYVPDGVDCVRVELPMADSITVNDKPVWKDGQAVDRDALRDAEHIVVQLRRPGTYHISALEVCSPC